MVKAQLNTGSFWELFGDIAIFEDSSRFSMLFIDLPFWGWKSLAISSFRWFM